MCTHAASERKQRGSNPSTSSADTAAEAGVNPPSRSKRLTSAVSVLAPPSRAPRSQRCVAGDHRSAVAVEQGEALATVRAEGMHHGTIQAGEQVGFAGTLLGVMLALRFPVAFRPTVTPDEETILRDWRCRRACASTPRSAS